MTRKQVRRVLSESFRAEAIREDIHGLYLGDLRFETGGGIAGNLGSWWIRVVGDPDAEPVGPFTRIKDLRAYLRGCMIFCLGIALMLAGREGDA